jgi:hypothetical protein
MDIPLPTNLPLLIGNLPDWKQSIVNKVLKGDLSVEDTLVELSSVWKIKVWFDAPAQIRRDGYRTKQVTEHTFAGFFKGQNMGCLCYLTKRGGRRGYGFGNLLRHVTKYEPVAWEDTDVFECYEQFRAKFDLNLIDESEVLSLWNGTSGQHGGKYKPSDFRRLTKTGLRLMDRFLERYKKYDVYMDYDGHKTLTEHYTSNSRCGSAFGRDITISHQTNLKWISYASEYPGCGNGRYGLIANKKQFLWLEDD